MCGASLQYALFRTVGTLHFILGMKVVNMTPKLKEKSTGISFVTSVFFLFFLLRLGYMKPLDCGDQSTATKVGYTEKTSVLLKMLNCILCVRYI